MQRVARQHERKASQSAQTSPAFRVVSYGVQFEHRAQGYYPSSVADDETKLELRPEMFYTRSRENRCGAMLQMFSPTLTSDETIEFSGNHYRSTSPEIDSTAACAGRGCSKKSRLSASTPICS